MKTLLCILLIVGLGVNCDKLCKASVKYCDFNTCTDYDIEFEAERCELVTTERYDEHQTLVLEVKRHHAHGWSLASFYCYDTCKLIINKITSVND